MKSVGILTFHYSPNYGAVLQSYALCRIVAEMGYVPELIDFRNVNDVVSTSAWHRRLAHRLWSSVFAKALAGSGRQRATSEFRKKFLPVSSTSYIHSEALRRNPPDYDFYICGSDQVWNLRLTNANRSYLLDFVPQEKKRISYAASFGSGGILDDHACIFRQELPKFAALSVREIEGRALVKDLVGSQVDMVLDPTLLITRRQWNDMASSPGPRRPYILCYYMPGLRHVTREISRAADQLAKETGFDVLKIGQKEFHRLIPGERNVFDAGPREFVSLLDGAAFVLTNSFHGTAFAVNFGKPFYAFVDAEAPSVASLSGRVVGLLEQLALRHRLVQVDRADVRRAQQFESSLDYSVAEPILEDRRARSIRFLSRALSS